MSDKYQDKIGKFFQIPHVGRAQLKYIGPIEGKEGIYVGFDVLANIGKNDGSFNGKRYFETVYPQSGIFNRLEKVDSLLESSSGALSMDMSSGSNSSSLPAPLPVANGSGESSEAAAISNFAKSFNRSSSVVYRSPSLRRYPSRSTNILGRRTVTSENEHLITSMDSHCAARDTSVRLPSGDEDIDMDIKSNVSTDIFHSLPQSPREARYSSATYDAKIKEQREEIMHYKRLLDEQRIVFEEIQPAIDDYEEKLRSFEVENRRLQKTLQAERESLAKHKHYFELEHKQLLSVVEELHKEIKENEERILRQQRRQTVIMEDTSQLVELDSFKGENNELRKQIKALELIKDDYEQMRKEWEQERRQLQMQNQSLNAECNSVSRQLAELKLKYESAGTSPECKSSLVRLDLKKGKPEISTPEKDRTVQIVELAMSSASAVEPITSNLEIVGESLPLYEGKKNNDATAGRLLWCALCEKDGHSAFECTEVAF
ncbi:HCL641Cp [Eremothecium sinecaudum]|uniref:HCL641Cp n=1 Tax=Eremothecium sinecaudum TaxID=45286 RepID=A0A109UVV7_9SACH|nr:HCL641Cp [Eremothecium sinecaudum]AMD19510.1 HCL641Cp [Eremothecium sinecaudum]